MRAHRNILYFLGAFFTMLGQLGATMFILSLMNTEDFSDISTEDHDNKKRRAVKMMQELLKNGTATNELKIGEIFGLLGVTASGYSYNMQFLFLVEEVELTCGIHQLEIVGSLFPNLARPAGIIGAAGEKSVLNQTYVITVQEDACIGFALQITAAEKHLSFRRK